MTTKNEITPTPTDNPQIHTLLPLVMADIGNIGKDQKNTQQKYNFRGIDDVLNHCNPALVKHGVTCSVKVTKHRVIEVETEKPGYQGGPPTKGFRSRATLKMRVRFSAPDGSYLDNTTAGEAMDYSGDKATNKAMAAAMKYAFFFGLVIPVAPGVVDDSDHDEKIPESTAKKKAPAKAAPKPANDPNDEIPMEHGADKFQTDNIAALTRSLNMDDSSIAKALSWASGGRVDDDAKKLYSDEATKLINELTKRKQAEN